MLHYPRVHYLIKSLLFLGFDAFNSNDRDLIIFMIPVPASFEKLTAYKNIKRALDNFNQNAYREAYFLILTNPNLVIPRISKSCSSVKIGLYTIKPKKVSNFSDEYFQT